MTGDFYDLDGDGTFESEVIEDPTTGSMTIASDADGDGLYDTVSVDIDGDGIADIVMVDSDGDGVADLVGDSTDTMVSVTGTDVLDNLDSVDSLDEIAIDGLDSDTTDSEPFSLEAFDAFDSGDSIEDVELDDSVHGDPMADIEYHQAQPGPVDCVPTSISMVVSELTGDDVAASEVVAKANDLDMMTDSGMSAEDGATLLEEYGVDAEVTSGTLDDLRTALDNDQNVIIGLDSADLYSGDGGPFDDQMTSGHAVVITGIDDDAGMVYINDPGFPDGAGVAIPIETFEDAWQDSDNTMITATPGDEMGSVPFDGGESEPSKVILPLRFRV